MNRLFLPVLILISSCSTLNEKADSPIRWELDNYGVVEQVTKGYKDTVENSVLGYGTFETDMVVTQTAREIPLRKGVIFGIEWCAYGNQESLLEYDFQIEHPAIVNYSGEKIEKSVSQIEADVANGKVCSLEAYRITEDSEMVEGNWTLSIIYKGQSVVSKEFKIK